VNKVALSFSSSAGEVEVCRNGRGMPFSEELAKKVLSREEITIAVTLGDGGGAATAYGCDLSYDYVRINGDYRS
jgi:glutamate N-acetyltransferase/amino-acid N-acetyltransferase